jgi:hypothetical protein
LKIRFKYKLGLKEDIPVQKEDLENIDELQVKESAQVFTESIK